jgi:hypothetical protein
MLNVALDPAMFEQWLCGQLQDGPQPFQQLIVSAACPD